MKKKLKTMVTLSIGSVVGFIIGYIVKAYQDLEKINDSSINAAEDFDFFDPPAAPDMPLAGDFDGDPLIDREDADSESLPFILILNDGKKEKGYVHVRELEIFKNQWSNRVDLIDEINKFYTIPASQELPTFEEGSFVGEWLKGILAEREAIIQNSIPLTALDKFGNSTKYNSEFYASKYVKNIETKDATIVRSVIVADDGGFTVYTLTEEEYNKLQIDGTVCRDIPILNNIVTREHFNSKMQEGPNDENDR